MSLEIFGRDLENCYLCGKQNTMKEKIIKIIYEKLPFYDGKIGTLSDFSNDLAADSLDMIDIVFAIEKEFGITIHEEEINGLNTVGDLVRLVKHKMDV